LKPILGFARTQPLPSDSSSSASRYFWTGTYTAHPGQRDQVLHYLTAFADEIVDSEPDTLNYIVLVPDDEENDEDTLYLWEQYSDERALREVHVKSNAAAGLKDTIGPLLKDRSMAGFRGM
jgi:quinol monooxygenase YgiN